MIVRQDGNELLLIGQTDHLHAWSGSSRRIGVTQNLRHAARRGKPSRAPRCSTTSAGLRYETNPVAGGKPTRRLASAPSRPTRIQLKSFQWCIDWLTDIDPYSGLIVSMHRTGLWRGAL